MSLITARAVPPALEAGLLQAGFSPLQARLYAARGIASPQELEHELKHLLPFTLLKNAPAMGARLADAIEQGKRLLIVGDYDADGATATTLAMKGLAAFGANSRGNVDFIVPNRFEYGYGLTPEIVTLASEKSPDIIITVDNGIASHAGVEAARQLGIEVLITDHHLPGDTLPDALIVNPNQGDCPFPSKNLAGVGVMFYVLMALRAEMRARGVFATLAEPAKPAEPNLAQWLDIVALGTVADVVKLDANNRILVEQGLKRMRAGRACPGIMALFTAAGRFYGRASCFDLGFTLGPRLNAAGRLDDMSFGINTLLASSEDAALPLARELDQLNRSRREIEQGMREEAERALISIDVADRYSLCLYQPDWHQGVVGIVASRVKDKNHRPTIVFADGAGGTGMGDDEIKGSGRSIPGLHLRDALDLVSKRHPSLIKKFGGHAMAAGLSLARKDFAAFEAAFEAVCRQLLDEAQLTRVIETDGELPSQSLQIATAELLDKQVWGQGFPAPVFCGQFRVVEQRIVGEKHSKLKLSNKEGILLEAMRFNFSEPIPRDINAVYKISVNEFRGERILQLQLEYCEAI